MTRNEAITQALKNAVSCGLTNMCDIIRRAVDVTGEDTDAVRETFYQMIQSGAFDK